MNKEKWAGYLKRFIGPVSDRAIPCLPYLFPWLEDCQKILDVGCGSGKLVKYLDKIGKDVTGITINPKEIEKKFKLNLLEMDVHKMGFPDNLFDAVIAWDVLEHTLAPFIALSEIFRILKPGGRFLCFIPSKEWISCEYHCIVLSEDQLRHLVQLIDFSHLELMKDESRSATKGGTIYKIIK